MTIFLSVQGGSTTRPDWVVFGAASSADVRGATILVPTVVRKGKGGGEALGRGNYRGLKLTDQVMKLLERVLDFFICEMVNIDEMQFGFVPVRGTTDAIFLVRQLQEKYIAAKKLLY